MRKFKSVVRKFHESLKTQFCHLYLCWIDSDEFVLQKINLKQKKIVFLSQFALKDYFFSIGIHNLEQLCRA